MNPSPLRLLFVSTAFPKTSETFVTDQVIGMHRLGHHVDVFTTGPGGVDDPLLQGELSQAVDHLLLPPGTPEQPDLAWLPQRRLPNWLNLRTWANLVRVGTTPRFYSLRYPLKRGAALLDRPDYDAVVCHFGPAGVMMQQMRDIGLIRAPLVTIFHGYDITNYLERVPADFYDELFARGDLFLPISDRWRRRLKELGCPVNRTQLQRLGTNLDTFAHDYRLPEPGEPLRLMSVARLVEKKGIEFAIKAVALLKAEGIAVSYDVIGDGPLRGELDNLVQELGLEDTVHFLGARSHDEVAGLMRDHHILMVPSVTDAQGGMEGIPVAIMEAMAAGLLVVGSVHSGIPEIVHHNENGLLAAERDEAGLARELARIAADLPEWRRLVGSAKNTAHQEYNLNIQNKSLADLLTGLTP